MNKFAQKSVSFIATGALLISTLGPTFAYADSTLTITGNGSDSNSTVNVQNTNSTTVTQSNSAHVDNKVSSTATTGGNNASDNTGGNTGISTGDATSKANVSTAVNENQAIVNPCNCNGDNKVVIAGNGTETTNTANLITGSTNLVSQQNEAAVSNDVNTFAGTGKNNANDNTGGTTAIGTGNATSVANVSTKANANIASVGSGNGGSGDTQFVISGNGEKSNNAITFLNANETTLAQANQALVNNDVNSFAGTGLNNASDNTGGNTEIGTGNAYAKSAVDTMANFNAADAGCGCDSTVTANVNGNGTDTKNAINATLGNELSVLQGIDAGNSFCITNPVDSSAKTGSNNTGDNTGTASYVDPVLNFTGNAWSESDVNTAGNVNIFGSVPTISWPDLGVGGNNFSFSFDFNFSQI